MPCTLKTYFDRAVNSYEKAGKIQKKVATELLYWIEEGNYSTVLEIGCGKGFLSFPLRQKIFYDRYIHIDISIEFLRAIRNHLREKSFYINARAESLPLKAEVADLLISSSTLHWLENPETSFLNLLSFLKNGGNFYFSIFTAGSLDELKKVSELSGFGSVYDLKDAKFYIEMLESAKIFFDYKVKTYRETFPTVKDLLFSHKLTGTNYTKHKKFSGKTSFRNFCNLYEKLFSNEKGIYATYEVLFIKGQK